MNRTEIAHEHLSAEWTEFRTAWQDSQSGWNDEAAAQFEKRFIAAFETEIPIFLSRLEALKDELRSAQRELR